MQNLLTTFHLWFYCSCHLFFVSADNCFLNCYKKFVYAPQHFVNFLATPAIFMYLPVCTHDLDWIRYKMSKPGPTFISILDKSVLLYPRHLCRQVYSFRFSVRMFVSSFSRICVKVLVKVSLVVYISCSYSQKPFIFGP